VTCCDPILTPFVNEATTTIPYTGTKPTVSVSYLIDGVWQAFVASVITLLSGSVVVDHGGLSTGVIKIVQ
jgi:hypothetical protein